MVARLTSVILQRHLYIKLFSESMSLREQESNIMAYFYGESETKYEFTIYPIDHSTTPHKAGIYIFAKDNGNSWGIIYIGQTHDFYNRIYLYLEDHDAWNCIQKNGATHVAIYEFSGTEQQRIRIETDLRNKYTGSPCNKQ